MSLFEAGKEYHLEVGPIEGPTYVKVRVISVDENWIKVTMEGGEQLLNTSSAYIISATEWKPIPEGSVFAPRTAPPGAR